MKSLSTVAVSLLLIGLPSVAIADLAGGRGLVTGVWAINKETFSLAFKEGNWTDEGVYSSDRFGEYLYTALLGVGFDSNKPVKESGRIEIKAFADPYLSLTVEFTNSESSPIDFSLFPIIETEAFFFDELTRATSRLSVEYIDHDGSGGIDAIARHRFFPQTESLGGFLAQEIELSIKEAGKYEDSLGPETPNAPDFPPPPYKKLNTILTVENLLPGDSVVLTGRSDIFAVPEPSSLALALLGTSVFAVGFCFRRRSGTRPANRPEDCHIK